MSKRVKLQVDTTVDDFPRIVSFPQGLPENYEEMQMNVSQKPSSKRVKTVVSSKVNGISYRGADFGDEVRIDGCKYAIGILDTKTNKMKVVSANHVFALQPNLGAFAAAPVRQSTMSYAERKKSLTEEFGSSKKKRAMKAAASNVISVENIMGAAALENSLATKPSAENDELIRIAQENLSRNKHRKK